MYAKFRNGIFKTTSSVSGTILITRHGNYQSELSNKGIKMEFEVKWLSDHTYTLKPTSETIKRYKIPTKALLTVTMGKVSGNKFFQITSSNLNDRRAGSEVIKVGE
ncbi:hypothetical protein GCM10028827_34740 [Mucilaginibacter myungsuensis]